ncbi:MULTISPECIES: glycosyltransferase family 39 protein [unclassified Paenibacillus]|uniref:glycosyltransferase family 39 protein n=1 Tax=unclassified Paenibacillus TaxID=185978 RepID=UPI00364475FB
MSNFQIGLQMNDIMYIGYNLLLALLLGIFKDPLAVIFIQAVTAGLSIIFVYKISRMLFNKATAIIASFFYYYYSWTITLWSMYILSDSFFISLLLLNVYLLLKFMQSNKSVYKVLFILSSLYILVFRPTGVVSLFFIMIYILINLDKQKLWGFVKKHRFVIGGSLTTGVIAGIYLFSGSKLDPFLSSMQFNAKMVLYNVYAKGWIYDRPSPYDYFFKPDYTINVLNSLILSFILNNWDHVSVLYGKRIIAFIGKWAWDIKLTGVRSYVRLGWYLLPATLFLIGTIAAIAKGIFRKVSILWLVILAVFVFCIILFIDGMYRYKAPSLPFIMIVVAYGLERVLHEAFVIGKKLTLKLLARTRRNTEVESGM